MTVDTGPGLVNLRDFETTARDRLDPVYYDYFASGAQDEITVEANEAAFRRRTLIPRVLRGCGPPRLETTVLGTAGSMPVLIAPTAFHRLACAEAEVATGRAAAAAGVTLIAAMLSTVTVEEIAATGATLWFQLYLQPDPPRAGRSSVHTGPVRVIVELAPAALDGGAGLEPGRGALRQRGPGPVGRSAYERVVGLVDHVDLPAVEDQPGVHGGHQRVEEPDRAGEAGGDHRIGLGRAAHHVVPDEREHRAVVQHDHAELWPAAPCRRPVGLHHRDAADRAVRDRRVVEVALHAVDPDDPARVVRRRPGGRHSWRRPGCRGGRRPRCRSGRRPGCRGGGVRGGCRAGGPGGAQAGAGESTVSTSARQPAASARRTSDSVKAR